MQEPVGGGSNDHSNHHHQQTGSGYYRRHLRPITVYHGQTSFRVLCHVNIIGALIGRSGVNVKQFERQSGARVRVDDVVPDCAERLITIVGNVFRDRTTVLSSGDERKESKVSQAQEALLLVYDRILEAELGADSGGAAAESCFRMLAVHGQVGALMGKRGKKIEKMRSDTGAKIRILPRDQIPGCASPSDELIQIMGSTMAVKKALVAVSRCLQENLSLERKHTAIGRPNDSNGEYRQHDGPSSSADLSTVSSTDANNEKRVVLFRLLCSNGAAGGVIGKGGAIVRALQNETGASISVAAPVGGSHQRVVTVSALENADSSFPSAQNAIIRVFVRAVEVDVENGTLSRLNDKLIVTVDLLVPEGKSSCLTGEGGTALSELRNTTGAEVQILGHDQAPYCALESDEVVQITGEYENVRTALVQVTCRLRDNFFSESSIVERMNHLVLNQKMVDPPSRLQKSQVGAGNIKAPADNRRTLANFKGDFVVESECKYPTIGNKRVEIFVSTDHLRSVYGVDGSNLARLKQISGAEVDVSDPCPGESKGKVVISGSVDQTRAAQSLLQAFILTG